MAKFLIVEARFYDHLNDLLIEAPRPRWMRLDINMRW